MKSILACLACLLSFSLQAIEYEVSPQKVMALRAKTF